MNDEQKRQHAEAMKDPEYAAAWYEAARETKLIQHRQWRSPFRLYWRLYYRLRGW